METKVDSLKAVLIFRRVDNASSETPKAEKPYQWSIRTSGDWIVNDRIQSAVWFMTRRSSTSRRCGPSTGTPTLSATRQKWWRAVDALNETVWNSDAEKVRALSSNLLRGSDWPIDEATTACHGPLKIDLWETALPQGKLRIIRMSPEKAYRAEGDQSVVTHTLEEIDRMTASQSGRSVICNQASQLRP